MDIGKTERIITVEPATIPVPRRTPAKPDRVPSIEPNRAPAKTPEPVRTPEKV